MGYISQHFRQITPQKSAVFNQFLLCVNQMVSSVTNLGSTCLSNQTQERFESDIIDHQIISSNQNSTDSVTQVSSITGHHSPVQEQAPAAAVDHCYYIIVVRMLMSGLNDRQGILSVIFVIRRVIFAMSVKI